MHTILTYILVGFVAQLIDGALGMAYGVSSTTFLISVGVAPALASASVHISEMFTTAVSGLAHLKFGNVNHALFRKLVVPGVVGGALGAYVLTAVPGEIIKPLISLYLLAMGVRILFKSFRVVHASEIVVDGRLVPLAAIGGFSDAIGGGGWGPIVTTTLVAQGGTPRMVIGSVNLAEFFVTIAESLTFVLALGSALTQHREIIVGLLSGGMLAAPLAAYVCQKLPTRALMGLVGTVIVLLSLRTLYLL
ncbi:MAG: sulfite exporter TauE/SafE family protein [Anaerolineae bacterium]|nr:sulfite exporter TauE/SafE family protein [Anaerolineae bacterium]